MSEQQNPSTAANPAAETVPALPNTEPSRPGELPPAAATVARGGRSAREEELERELEAERGRKKKAEQDAAYAKDELDRLRRPAAPPPAPKTKEDAWTVYEAHDTDEQPPA